HTPDYTKDFNEAWENSQNPPFCGWVIKDGGIPPLTMNISDKNVSLQSVSKEKPALLNLSQDANDWHRFEGPERIVAQITYSPTEYSDDSLISPRLNCSIPGTYILKFWHAYYDWRADPPIDSGCIYISTNGGASWELIDYFSNEIDEGEKTYDITNYASGQPDVRIMFRYKAYDELYWQIDDFEVLFAPIAPTLLTPADGALTNDPTPDFDWSDVMGATEYHLQVDNDNNFSSPEIDVKITTSNYTPTTPLADGHYWWRVRSKGQTLWGSWSTPWTFTIDATPPEAPALKSPANNAVIATRTPTFVWGKVTFLGRLFDGDEAVLPLDNPGITYRLQVDDDSTFGSPAINITTSDTTYTVPSGSPLEEKTYYWRVNATDDAGNTGAWSVVWRFTIRLITPGWHKKADVTGATKPVKSGGALVAVGGKVYALVGNNT
ncbi:MAG: hypothetical protein N2748_04710, partial [candidate division WOR-3 bacterium]|nr:hypothetical protein [candidate division WOR-3 bacterium]